MLINPVATAGFLDQTTGSWTFGTTGGDPTNPDDNDLTLVEGAAGVLYIAGGTAGTDLTIGEGGLMLRPPTIDKITQTASFTWRSDDIENRFTVDFKLRLVRDVVRWEFRITNNNAETKTIGFRHWVDVDWGKQASGPYFFPGSKIYTTSEEFIDGQVPTEWHIRYSDPEIPPKPWEYKPQIRMVTPLLNNVSRPSRLCFATITDIMTYGWREVLEAALPENINEPPPIEWGVDMLGDEVAGEAVSYFYPLTSIRYNETKVYTGEMRLEWAQVNTLEQFALALQAPEWVGYRAPDPTVMGDTGYYDPEIIDVNAYICNSSMQIEPMATVTIDLGKGLVLDPVSQPKSSMRLRGMVDQLVNWKVRMDKTAYGRIPVRVTATLVPGGSITSTTYVNVPALPSMPVMTLQSASQFVGFPFSFTDANALVVLQDLNTKLTGMGLGNLNVAWYDPVIKDYRESSTDDVSLVAGRGYWINIPTDPNTPNIENTLKPLLLAGASSYDQRKSFSIRLEKGWNAISSPYQFSIIWGYCHIYKNYQEYTIADAIKQGYIRRELWTWDASNKSYSPVDHNPPTNPYPAGSLISELKPFQAYWLYSTGSCYLVYMPNPFTAPMDPLLPDARATKRRAGQADSWQVNILAETSTARDVLTTFGVSANEQDGLSDGDRMKPPVNPGGLSVYFPHQNWSRLPANYAVDLQAPGAVKTWTIDVQCTKPNERVVLRWPDLTQLPPRVPVIMTDNLTGQRIALRTTPCYAFNSGQGGVRRFTITVGGAAQRLQINQAQAIQNRAANGVTISYAVTMPAQVTLRLCTANGRLVRTLGPLPVDGGQSTFLWDGRDNQGRTLPAGLYLCELYAEAQDGQRIRTMLTLRKP